MRNSLLRLSALGLIAASTGAYADTTQLACGSTIDVISGKKTGPRVITITDGKITGVATEALPAKDAERIDLSNMTCMPGFMDMHTHLTSQISRTSYIEGYTKNTAHFAIRAVDFAEKTLQAGFTTVRNPGDDGTITRALRDAIAKGTVEGPRIFTSGKAIGTTGGHADPTNGRRQELMGDPAETDGVVNGPSSAMKAVRQRYKEGADFIKITATGGVLSTAKNGQNPQFTQEELDALVQVANDYGMRVAAHAHGSEGMKRAVRAGVASIEHGTLMDDETMRLMKQKGTYLVPTMMAGAFVAEKAEIDGYFPEIIRPKARAIGPKIAETFGKAYKMGIKIAYGTDCGVSPHGNNAQEFKLMVDAGMSPMEAIQAATINSADLLGEKDSLGSLSSGKAADIVAVVGDPLENITILEDVQFVMKDGKVYKGS